MSELIHFDQQLFLSLNGSESTFLDHCFLLITKTGTWLPLLVCLLLLVAKMHSWKVMLLFAVCLALVILVCDQTASTICKPLFHRFRPSHEPALEGLVDLVNGRRGGLYGFFSSHAANTFGVAQFTAYCLRGKYVKVTMFTWAVLSSYSRIYLGFHYPGDILVGLLYGLLIGYLIFRLYKYIAASKWFVASSEVKGSGGVALSADVDQTTASNQVYGYGKLLFAAFLVTLLFIAMAAAVR